MNILIIGIGSIAKKHIHSINKILPKKTIYALRSAKSSKKIAGIKNLYNWQEIPNDIDFIIISNPTIKHYETIERAIKLNVPLFIEKPPLAELNSADKLIERITENNIITYVAFNFRFHPIIRWLKDNLSISKVREVNIYCGSYLPNWRPNIDYTKNYSAIKEMGGGVHLDLIHELDYTRWIFGDPSKIKSEKNKKSNLQINSFDYAHYLLEYKNFYTSITLNYYRKDPKRSIEIILEEETLYADLINCSIMNSKNEIVFDYPGFYPLFTYEEQMNYFLSEVIKKQKHINDFKESIKTLELCLA